MAEFIKLQSQEFQAPQLISTAAIKSIQPKTPTSKETLIIFLDGTQTIVRYDFYEIWAQLKDGDSVIDLDGTDK